MSDLDADLYGDLYGNDEVELNEDFQEEPELLQEPTSAEATTTLRTAEKAPSPPPQRVTQDPPAKSQIPTYTSPTPSSLSIKTPIATYTQSAPQQIPTYEQPQPQDYRDTQQSRNQSIPVPERSVRPSEMKDEG
ncbi:hypothetical protein P691DRAFT_589010 [Macrolepiota fuliginosa MF-IS2]|uniref:Uncharacterized protein n=1 Tax=Macrolepiota fuliginosa MF-IS2 TaxID=1400762 RepID=A0A9P5XFT9_9AGAR|nr:hypothetical protein P691DRAFT_589010 [Macrolepiota fuliginosa MF-IS2]